MVVIEFLIYNPNLEMLAKKNFVIEFLESGPMINIEHQVKITNMKMNRDGGHIISSVISALLGVGLCFLSFIDIKNHNNEILKQKLEEMDAEGEEGGAPPGEEENDLTSQQLVPGDDKEKLREQLIQINQNVFHILWNCHGSQKINFFMIFMVISTNIIKHIYDAVADSFLH